MSGCNSGLPCRRSGASSALARARSVALAGLVLLATPAAQAAEVTLGCPSNAHDQRFCREAARLFESRTAHTVRIVPVPPNATQALALYQQALAARSGAPDVIQVDTVWQGLLGPHLVDLESALGARGAEWSAPILENNRVSGRLVSIPAWVDVGLLYYRKDLLEKHGRPVPATWAELTETARLIQADERAAGRSDLWGFVWQGRAYEGLTVNALEWVASHGGGTFLDREGRPSLDNPRAARALALAASWIGDISPPGVLTYAEEEARVAFQAGNAVFMRNWTYPWSLLEAPESAVAGRVGVAPLPAGEGGRPAAGLGGWSYGVNAYSRNRDAATELVLLLTSPEMQRMRAVGASRLPAVGSIFTDEELRRGNPFVASLRDVLPLAVARPATEAGSHYGAVSAEIFNTVHGVLSGRESPEIALAGFEGRLRRALRGRQAP